MDISYSRCLAYNFSMYIDCFVNLLSPKSCNIIFVNVLARKSYIIFFVLFYTLRNLVRFNVSERKLISSLITLF